MNPLVRQFAACVILGMIVGGALTYALRPAERVSYYEPVGRYTFTQSGVMIFRFDTITGQIDVTMVKDGKLQTMEFTSAQVPPISQK